MSRSVIPFAQNSKKDGNNSEDGKGNEFKRLTKRTGDASFAALYVHGIYSTTPGEKEFKALEDLKERVRRSNLPEKDKKRFVGILETVKKTDTWDVEETSRIVANSIEGGSLSGENLEYRLKALEAWRSGRIKELGEKELKELDGREMDEAVKQALRKMLMIGINKSDLCAALAIRALSGYIYKPGKREDMIEGIEKVTETLALL